MSNPHIYPYLIPTSLCMSLKRLPAGDLKYVWYRWTISSIYLKNISSIAMLKYPSINHNKPQKEWDNYGNNRSLTPLRWRAWKSSMRWWLAPGFLELEITVPWRVQRIQGRYPRWKRSVDISINLCLPLYINIISNLLTISICHCLPLFIIYDIHLLSFTYVLSIYVWTLQTILLETWGIFLAMLDCWVKTPGSATWRWPELCACIESSWFRQGCSWSRTILGTWQFAMVIRWIRCSHFCSSES